MARRDFFMVKPLDWTFYDDFQEWQAKTIFCTIHVEKLEDGCYRWRYCVDEYYDESEKSCESFDDGKDKAQAWYLSRLLPALIEAGYVDGQ